MHNDFLMNHDVKTTEMTGGSHSSKVGVVLGSIGAVIVLIVIGFILFLCKRKKKAGRSEVFTDVPGWSLILTFSFMQSKLVDGIVCTWSS